VSSSVDLNDVVPDHSECACHAPLVPVTSDDVPMVEEVSPEISPKEVHVQFNCEVKNVLGTLDTSMENPPSYAMSGQCCIYTKGHINSSHPKSYQRSNYFLGQCLGLQSMIDC